MKKMNRAISVVLIILTAIAGFTCKPGLGSQIDILPPSGEIIYPDAGETPIRGSFILRGTAKDDEGVRAVSIVFENIETKDSTRSFPASLSKPGADSTEWTVSIDNEPTGTEAPPHELVKIYPIPDGEYTAIVTVTDKGGKPSTFTKNYKIDNTPPVFIVQRPSTVAGKDETPVTWDGYGAIFSVVGQAGERNTVEKLDVRVTGAEPIQTMFVGNNINAQIAVFRKTDPKDPLYELQDKDKTKPLKGEFYLYDNARERTGGGASTEGNKADWYYQWEDVYTDVIAKGYTPEVISDYFAGKKGSNKNEHDQKILALRGDTDALNTLKSAMIKMEEKRSTFKLDPSTSPGFKVIGIKNLPKNTLNLAQATSMLFKTGTETAFPVELIRNKNKDSLINGIASNPTAYTGSNIEIVLFKWNGTGSGEDSFKNNTNLEEKTLVKFSELTDTNKIASKITVADGNLRVKCTFDPSWGEGYYIVKVKGTDTIDEESHKFQEYDDSNSVNDGMYIINFLAVGTGPRIRPIRPQGFKNTTVDIEADVTGIDAAGAVYYNIDAPVNTASPDPSKILTKVNADPTDPRYKAAGVTISGLSDGIHKIHFLAKTSSGSTDKDTTEFTVDKTGPTIEIVYPEESDPQAGEIVVSGRISDEWAGVNPEKTKYILGKKPSTPTVDTAAGWKIMKDAPDTSTKGSWSIHINLDNVPSSEHGAAVGTYKKIPLYIFTEDELGNKAVHEKTILFDPDGTKPVVKVSSPQEGATVGGTIQIFGTANVPKGGAGAVDKVYIQFSHDGSFANAADGTFGSKDWYNGGNGLPITTDTGAGAGQDGADWRISINADNAFNHATNQNQTVYFKLRAKNKSNVWGEWTEKRKIIVDKDAPLITDVKIDNDSGTSSPQDYNMNMWIKNGKKLTAKLVDPSGIQDVKITFKNGTIETKYQKKDAGTLDSGYTAVPTGWLTDYSLGGKSGYELNLPFDISSMSGDSFSVTIVIREKDAQHLSSQSSFLFRFDKDSPIGDFGKTFTGYVANATFATDPISRVIDSITSPSLADAIRSNPTGLKMLVGNTIVSITNAAGFSGNKVTFTPALASGGKYSYVLYKPDILVKAVSGNDWIVPGVANDDGSGVQTVTAKLEVGSESQSVTMTELDPSNKIYRLLDGLCRWEGHINLSTIPDGKGKLTYTVTDHSGNIHSAQKDVRVKNKAFTVSSITLVTNVGGAETSSDGALSGSLNSDLDFIGTFTSSKFAFKDKTHSKIKVAFTGGEGQVKYNLKYAGNVLAGHDMQNIGNGDIITLSPANLNTIGNTTGETTKELTLELWDSAQGGCTPTGATPLEKSSFAQIKINTLFDALDDNPPKVVMLPFYWNGEGKDSNNNSLNSLYEGSSKNGHVEIAPVTGLTANTSDNNSYSSVSGKVTLRGFAYDNIKIHTVTAVLPGKTLTATLSDTGTKWTAGTMASDDAVLTVEKLGADYLGYYVKWTLDWNTEKTTSVGLAQEIKITVHDGTTVSSDGKANMPNAVTGVTRANENSAQNDVFTGKNPGQFVVFTKGEKQYLTRLASVSGNKVTLENNVPVDVNDVFVYGYNANEAKTNVNVVPFITGLKRPDTYNTNRSSSGAYNLLRNDMVTVTGFNLGGTGATVKAKIPNVTSEQAVASNKFTLPAAAKSGSIVITVDPDGAGTKPAVEAINNKSNNSKPYNRQELANRPETQYWTDDLTIDVWKDDEDFAGSNNPKYPSMAMGSNGDLYAAYSNYSDSKVYYSKLGDAPQSVYWGYDPPEEAAISVSGTDTVNILYSANYHGGLPAHWIANITRAGGLYCYDTHAPNFLFFNDNGGKIYRFELFYHQKQLQQFKNFRIARKNNNIHIAYYDTMAASVKYSTVQSGTTNADINFHNGQYDMADDKNNRSEIAWVDLDGSTLTDLVTDPNLKRVGTVAKLVDGSSGQFEGSLTRTGSTAEYCALALDGSNRPVVVYADVDTGTLRLARANAETPTAATNWKVQKVLPADDANTGRATDYFAAQFDSAGYLHIVFRNTKGQICYVKSTNKNTGTTVDAYTFGKSVVIAENGSRVELTMEGTTPYVAYLSKTNAYDGIQIAYYDTGLVKTWKSDGSADQTGAWNVMTAAMKHRAGDARACVAVAPASVTTWKAAVGYTPGSIYRVVKYVK
ncbi:hypothetical protein ABH09_07600 [Treponema sp. OMZ 803]|uniref:hypothetical protein n=1 Tax=Treponema sp. OMZ 803 TaxID=120682 RepID=UPI0020A33A2D|nr:hypothetical protein [Treponema sp. OMZ 803]UTC52236.1 hypothetical protein ABH09_07600 [Treponema sp. OMZ 803]